MNVCNLSFTQTQWQYFSKLLGVANYVTLCSCFKSTICKEKNKIINPRAIGRPPEWRPCINVSSRLAYLHSVVLRSALYMAAPKKVSYYILSISVLNNDQFKKKITSRLCKNCYLAACTSHLLRRYTTL